MADISTLDCATGEIVERNFTPEEKAQREADEAAAALERAEAEAKAQAAATATSDAIAHAKSLGFTDEMIAVMYPSLIG